MGMEKPRVDDPGFQTPSPTDSAVSTTVLGSSRLRGRLSGTSLALTPIRKSIASAVTAFLRRTPPPLVQQPLSPGPHPWRLLTSKDWRLRVTIPGTPPGFPFRATYGRAQSNASVIGSRRLLPQSHSVVEVLALRIVAQGLSYTYTPSGRRNQASFRRSAASRAIAAATARPPSKTSGMPPPGWVAPPTKYSPRTSGERSGGRTKAAMRLFEDGP